MFSPLRRLRIKNSFDDHGLAISVTLAMPGFASVA